MKTLRKILFPTQFETLTYSSLESLLPLKKAGLEEVVFLYVLDRDEVGFVPFGGFDKKLAKELKLRADLEFADWGKELQEKGLCWKAVVEVGNPEPKILDVAKREDVDLIAIGRHLKPLDSIIPSGTEFGILRDSRVPVLFLVSGKGCECEEADGVLLDHILLATDFSRHSNEALEFLEELAPEAGKVSVVHVIEKCDLDEAAASGEPLCEIEAAEALKDIERALRARGFEAEAHLFYGDPAGEILRFAGERNVTLIIAGTRGKRSFEEYFLGSVPTKIAEETKIPTLFVPLSGES